MWRPVSWTHARASRDVTCVGRVVGGGRRVVRFEQCDVHAYVSGVPFCGAAERCAARAPGARVERADVRSIYAEHEPATMGGMLRVTAPSSAALAVALVAVGEANEAGGSAAAQRATPFATFESGVTSLTRLLQRRGYAPHGLLSLENEPIANEPIENESIENERPCAFVVAVRSSCAVLLDGETHEVPEPELARWLDAREVDVLVSFDSEARVDPCVSIRLRAVLADGKCSTLEELARATLGAHEGAWGEGASPPHELSVLSRMASELGVVEHLVELANVTGVQLRDVVRRGVMHRSLEQVLRVANAAGYVLPDAAVGGTVGVPPTGRPALVGGLVLEPVVGVHREAVCALDFASMYPSLIMAHDLCYTATGAVLPPLMRALRARRETLQRAAREATAASGPESEHKARRLDARQRAVKLAMNCVYGMAACADGPLPCARLAAQITAAGRDALRLAASELASAATVVYGDSVTADTRVVVREAHDALDGARAEGRVVTVAELFDAYEREPAAPPLLTCTLDGLAPIRAVLRRESTKRVFRVTLASGASVDVTADHSLVAHDGSLVAPRDLVVGETRLATRDAAVIVGN